MFNKGNRGGEQPQQSKNFGAAIARLAREMRGFWIVLVIAFLLAIGGAVISVVAPSHLSDLADEISKGIFLGMDFEAIKSLTMLLAGLYLFSAAFSSIQSVMMADTSNKFARDLRGRISRKINRMPLGYFDQHQSGDTLSRVTNDVDTIAQSTNQSLPTLVSAVTLLLGALFKMFTTNWKMALTSILSSSIGFVFMGLILKKSQKYFTARQVALGKLNSHIEETCSSLNVIKAYSGEQEIDEKFDKLNYGVYEANCKSQLLSTMMHPIMGFIGNFGYVAVFIVGAILMHHGEITIGTIIAFTTYVRLFTNPLSQIAQAAGSLQSAAAASERVFEFLDEAEMSDESSFKKQLKRSEVRGDIEFKHVKFGYSKDRTIIKDFSAKAKAGQKIAIVGPTGAGKTTLVNLLMKFYDIDEGEILIDGTPTSQITRENLHALFTMVLQDTWLFNGTLRDNILYNRTHVSDKRLMEICDEVGLKHFVKTLSNGFDTDISGDDSISAGQKQLITIARGMVEDAPFLILDEATSNVDTRTEELVQSAMDKLMQGRTSFIIAHRLSTIRNADLILVMNEGNIVESGNHDELMKQNGAYAELYNSQFQL